MSRYFVKNVFVKILVNVFGENSGSEWLSFHRSRTRSHFRSAISLSTLTMSIFRSFFPRLDPRMIPLYNFRKFRCRRARTFVVDRHLLR